MVEILNLFRKELLQPNEDFPLGTAGLISTATGHMSPENNKNGVYQRGQQKNSNKYNSN